MTEAGDVAADFNGWLDDHFLLSSYQTAYLDDVPDMVRKTWGHLFAVAFLRRSLITMVTPPDNPPPRRTKEVRKNMAGLLTYNDDTKELDGELSIAITWDLW